MGFARVKYRKDDEMRAQKEKGERERERERERGERSRKREERKKKISESIDLSSWVIAA